MPRADIAKAWHPACTIARDSMLADGRRHPGEPMTPLLSVCIPTFNRADLLDDTLGRLRELERHGQPFEIVVSDNVSTDATANVIERHRRSMPYLRACVQREPAPVYAGLRNAARNARGLCVVNLSDDDSLIAGALWAHVERLVREPDLAAIYTDWIAWDDNRERELHRYFAFKQPVSFGPDAPLDLVSFVLQHVVYPEVAVYRRDALLASDAVVRRGVYPFHLWAYQLSRRGRIAFDLAPYYREHRVLKPRFRRASVASAGMRLHIIGDEFRNQLETIVLWALQDAGSSHVPDNQASALRQMIDRYLNARLMLEVGRAVQERDWLLALELRRRMVLWYGPGSEDEQRRDALEITYPAALQAIRETYGALSGVSGLKLEGFETEKVHDFFRAHYPDVALVGAAGDVAHDTSFRPLVVSRDGPSAAAEPTGYRLALDRLLDTYRVNTVRVDLAGL